MTRHVPVAGSTVVEVGVACRDGHPVWLQRAFGPSAFPADLRPGDEVRIVHGPRGAGRLRVQELVWLLGDGLVLRVVLEVLRFEVQAECDEAVACLRLAGFE